MSDTPKSRPEPAPPADAAAAVPCGPLAHWFEPVRVAREAPAELAELARRGRLVFVMRSAGLLDYLYLKWLLRRHGLPPLRAARGFGGLFGWIARVRRTRRAFAEAVTGGDAALVFLGRAPARKEEDPFAQLAALQRELDRPIFLLPALLVWSRRAQRLEGSIWDVLYGTPEAPTAFANVIAFLRNFRRAFFDLGRPLDLAAFVRERADEPDAVIARKARGALRQHLAREFRTAVGPPLKTPSRVEEKVLRDRTLRATLDRIAAESGRPGAALAAEARKVLREIASRYDQRFVGVMRILLSWIFGRIYRSVEVDEEGLARLKRAAGSAPIVLCPSHKSHIDYLVLSWLLYEHGMTPPHVAAGINLAFWPFGSIARRGGAFFIRRKVKGDRIYTAVLRAYVKYLLRERFPQEFYVEGGRSRTGKLLFPKMGLVSMEVDAWLDGAAEDVVFVPVAVDYEKLIEAGSYARELSGAEKQKESLRGLLGAATVLFGRYERLYVQFEEPISLKAAAEQRLGARAASLTIDEAWGGEVVRAGAPRAEAPAEAKRQLVQTLANRIAYGISRAVTITPVGLFAATVLSHARRGIAAPDVARRVELLRYVAASGGARFARDLAGAPSDPREAGPIADAVRRLARDGLVRVEVAAGETIYQVDDDRRPLLDYHRNAVIHRFVAPALVAAAVRASGPDATPAEAREHALWLSRLFKLEFLYRVGATAHEIFDENLELLVRIGVVVRDGDAIHPGPEAEHLDFLAGFVRAYLEAYRLAAETAQAVVPGEAVGRSAVDRKGLVKAALERGRADFLAGRIALRETLSKATLENAVEWLAVQGYLARKDAAVIRGPKAEALPILIERIATHLATGPARGA